MKTGRRVGFLRTISPGLWRLVPGAIVSELPDDEDCGHSTCSQMSRNLCDRRWTPRLADENRLKDENPDDGTPTSVQPRAPRVLD